MSLQLFMPVEDYYKVFKSKTGEELKSILAFCLQFDRIKDASAEMQKISKRPRKPYDVSGRRVLSMLSEFKNTAWR